MSKEIFLIDSNSLITPHLAYYPFDFAPGFWTQMEKHIKAGSIKILDMVKNEICRGKETDNLKVWMEELEVESIDHRENEILEKYAQIVQYLSDSSLYKPSALAEWSRESVADPWLIAVAATYDYTLITFEKASGGLSKQNPNKFAKIPDVATAFGVRTQPLYYLMRSLGFRLS